MKDVIITKMEKISDAITCYIALPKQMPICPSWLNKVSKVLCAFLREDLIE
ncbi:hypothetical protein [Kurthia sibirica]|uniref:hypothetical protein n=1 Tax=Kurthia sibirica TaxID=202750 RepID=UPI001474F812|nr:hypothetical protein [Kurthia sibirica]